MPGITIDELNIAKKKLVKKGFLPIPAHCQDKRPLLDWRNYKLGDWSKAAKNMTGVRANIGVLTGEKSNVIVLDVDNKVPAKAAKHPDLYRETTGVADWQLILEEGKYEEPQTLKCQSPSGGLHYYFLWDEDFAQKVKTTNSCVITLDGRLTAIDLRGEGGFIMTPPSITDLGQYVWQPHDKIADISITKMPAWLKGMIVESSMSKARKSHKEVCDTTYTVPFQNDILDRTEDWERFKRSDLFNGHEFYKIDAHQRMILKETVDFDCRICERRHVNHSNHPFLVKRGNDLLFVCRQSKGSHKFVAEVKDKVTCSSSEPGNDNGDKEDETKDTPHQVLMKEIWKVGKQDSLQKHDGWIYKPISKNQPAAYKRYKEYPDFVNGCLRNNPVFTSTPKRFDDVMKHLVHYDDTDLPFMTPDLNLLAFRNGCLLLKEVELVNYDDKRVKGKVARHFIDVDYTGTDYTPVFDAFVLYQLEDNKEEQKEVYDILLALIGRLYFKVSECDRWGVAPYILGNTNTGKSTLWKIIRSMHGANSIGIIAGTHQNTFGLEDLFTKSLIAIPEVPHNLKDLLDPTVLQTMVTGEETSIVGKHKKAFTGIVDKPIICFGNLFFNYDDKRGAIVRRFPVIWWGRFIEDRDSSIDDVVIQNELPQLICKCLKAYKRLREEHKKKDFWDFAPVYFVENKEYANTATNWLYKFLTASPDSNKSSTCKFYARKRTVAGSGRISTDLEDVKKAFLKYMQFNYPKEKYKWDDTDHSTFKSLGYDVVKINKCKSCKQQARGGKEPCCPDYGAANRSKKVVIYDLELVKEEDEPDEMQVFHPVLDVKKARAQTLAGMVASGRCVEV